MKIKKSFVYMGTIFLLVAGVAFLFFNSGGVLPNAIDAGQEVQVVKLSVKNGNYVFEPTELRKGVKTRLEANMNAMPGCSRSIVIPEFGVRKTFTSDSNFVEFVPNKSGRFNIACSMNMYRGEFVVED